MSVLTPPPFVPRSYDPLALDGATLWSRRPLPDVANWVTDANARVARCLDHRLSRRLHVVAYDSVEDCERALCRSIHVTALLAPLHREDLALIALHAPSTHHRNNDPVRMLRHLCHELAHVHVAEVTGSVKRLGDGGTGMHVRPWVDEGIAECTAAIATEDGAILERARLRSQTPMSDGAIDAALLELYSPDRAMAFAHATMRIWRAVQARGIAAILRDAAEPDRLRGPRTPDRTATTTPSRAADVDALPRELGDRVSEGLGHTVAGDDGRRD